MELFWSVFPVFSSNTVTFHAGQSGQEICGKACYAHLEKSFSNIVANVSHKRTPVMEPILFLKFAESRKNPRIVFENERPHKCYIFIVSFYYTYAKMPFFISGLLQLAYGDSLIAWFDMSKLKGSIELQKDVENTTIISNFKYDAEEMSASKNITKLKIFKQLPNLMKQCETISTIFREYDIASNETKVITEQFVSGANSLLGHTLAVYDIHDKILGCATLVTKNSGSQYAIAYVSNKNVGGKIEFIQNKFNDTAIFGEFQFMMDDVSSLSYHISNRSVYSKHGSCDAGLQIIDASGNFSGKLETLNITKPNTKQIFISYPVLTLSDLIGKAFVISNNNAIIGCGNIYLSGPLEVQSSFNASEHKGISGYLKFTQVSPYHPTKLEVSLDGLDNRVNGYHVHQFPISDMENPCSPGSVGGHLNPTYVDPKESPKPMKGNY